MNARFLIFIFLFSFASMDRLLAKSFDGACKAPQPMKESHLTPQGIQAWLNTVGSKVKTVRDFVCCLPQEYRSNYMVGHSSIAGQNGTPDSPRVIVTNRTQSGPEGKTPVRMLMSLNGGQHGMAGAKSIEIAYINPQNKEAEYFDLSFEDIQKSRLSHKNPESCMNCHGDQGKAPPGGAKLIFDIFGDWPRFVGGATQCNPIEDHLQSLVSDQAIKSVKTNPQYECLDKSQLEKDRDGRHSKLFGTLAQFDNSMGDVVRPQRQRWIKSLPKWNQYKYLFAAAQVCDISKLSEWVGHETYRKNMANLEIDPRLKKEGRIEDIFRAAIADEEKRAMVYRKNQEKYLKDKNFPHRAMEPNSSSRACDNEVIKNIDYYAEVLKNDKSVRFEDRDPISLLFLDNILRGPRFTKTLPGSLSRFFLEGEGYGTFFIQKSLRRGDLIHGELEFPPEPYESELFQFFGRNKDGTPAFNTMKLSREQTCSELKARSIHAFEGAKTTVRSKPGER